MNNLIEAVGLLLKFIEDNNVQDEMTDDGDGHIDMWRSSQFSKLITDAQEELNGVNKRIEFRPPPDPESLTCSGCPERYLCKYVDDPYNTDGNCLAMK